MLAYYIDVGMHGVRRNLALTALTVAAIAIGIGTSMTVFTVLHTLSADPIPEKSARLFVPFIDNWGPDSPLEETSRTRLSYRDALALMQAHQGSHQTAMYAVKFVVNAGAADSRPFEASGRAVFRDFFPMFNVPFKSGGPWSAADDQDKANVVIIGAGFAARLFPHENAVGRTVTLNEHDYRVVGVIDAWNPQPRVYDVSGRDTEDVFLPFSTAIDRQIERASGLDCNKMPDQPGWFSYLNSECIWFGFWVELPAAAAARSYRDFLSNYAAEQTRLGRFHWAPHVALYDMRTWLSRQKVVPDEVRLATTVAFGFLIVCLLNSTGLLLAKFSGGSGEFSVRRALGASKIDIFAQCFAETAAVGCVGGLLGLFLTMVGLRVERSVMDDPLGRLTHLDSTMVLFTLILAIVATIGSGLYPAWRASRVQPALHLKVQ